MTLDETFLPLQEELMPPVDPNSVRMGAFQERSFVAGPGCRAVIWVTGCLRRCPGCMKPEFLPFDVGEEVSVEALAERVLSIVEIEGVTYSGGEPFEQAVPLAGLSRRLKQAGLSIASYSGYRREALEANPSRFGTLLTELDLLIDGEYREDTSGPRVWRGSVNQRLHYLSDFLPVSQPEASSSQEVQISLEAGQIRITGFPDRAMEEAVLEHLSSQGINVQRQTRSQSIKDSK